LAERRRARLALARCGLAQARDGVRQAAQQQLRAALSLLQRREHLLCALARRPLCLQAVLKLLSLELEPAQALAQLSLAAQHRGALRG
jgi:hypothetical protein